MKRKHLFLLLVLGIAVLLLSGCGVNHDGVDVINTPPDGLWQTIIVWPLAKALIYIDQFLVDSNVPYHWGFAIIIFTVLVRLVMFPLTLSQIRGMQAQKELQPKLQELQKKYGKDREKMVQEQTKLYQEAGVNPLSGCLPLVLQMPVLFGLYSALVATGPSLKDSAFFWIPDLSFPSYTQGMGWVTELFNAGDYGRLIGYLILPVLLMVSQFVMQKWMSPMPAAGSDNSQARMMQQMTLMMTFMFGIFTIQVPAGLTLYWVTSNLLQMLQQWITTSDRFNLMGNKTTTVDSAVVKAETSAGKSSTSNGIGATAGIAASDAEAVKAAALPKRRKAKRK
ncbi:MAG: membrane protein insertase YidC [Caldilineaceae bacterium]|nr:membrane protein insertase YidC [Caldilineaceae bacterium]